MQRQRIKIELAIIKSAQNYSETITVTRYAF